DRVAERHELEGVEPGAVGVDDGEPEVRVGLGVAVAGKVFGDGEHSPVLEPFDVRGDEDGDLRRVLAERARVDDRVGRVRVDVGDGREGEVDAGDAGLGGGGVALFVGEAGHAGGADGHLHGEQRG